jgi:hypothetical protein
MPLFPLHRQAQAPGDTPGSGRVLLVQRALKDPVVLHREVGLGVAGGQMALPVVRRESLPARDAQRQLHKAGVVVLRGTMDQGLGV